MRYTTITRSMKFVLAPHAITSDDGDSILIVAGREMLRIDLPAAGSSDMLRDALARLRRGCTPDELSAMLHDGGVYALVARLTAMHAIVRRSAEDSGPAEHWERQLGYLCGIGGVPDRAQQAVCDAHVAIIGVGGVGCIVLQHLLGAGVRHIDVIDFDVVALHNLNRQYIYHRDDIGRPKVDVAARYARAMVPDARISCFPIQVAAPSDLAPLDADPPDIILLAADHPVGRIQEIVDEFCMGRSIPFAGAAVGLVSGYWGPLVVPGVTACHGCFDRAMHAAMSDDERRLHDRTHGVTPYSFGPHNSIISSHLAADVITFLAGGTPPSLGARMVLDLSQLGVTRFPVVPCACPYGACAAATAAPNEACSERMQEGVR